MKRRKRLQAGAPQRRAGSESSEVRPVELASALSGQLRLQLDLIDQLVASQELLREERERRGISEPVGPKDTPAIRTDAPSPDLDLNRLPVPAYTARLQADGTWRYTELNAPTRTLLFPEEGPQTLLLPKLLERIHPDDRANVERSHALRTPQRGSLTYRVLDATGVHRRLEDRFQIGTDPSGAIERLGLWLVDTQTPLDPSQSQHLRAENERLEQHSREQARFLAQATHELRTPLNAILGLAQLIADAPAGDPEASRHLHTLEQHSQFLLALVDDVLDLSRFESGHAPLHPESIELRTFLSETVEMVRPLSQAKGLGLKLVVGDKLPTHIQSDPMRVRQILLNLLANAIKFTPKGHVELAARPDVTDHGPELRFSITDTGRGIAAKDLAAIFEPFEQGTGEMLSPSGGTGLGLAIARKWADALEATLSVRSTPGEGSCFELHLPVESSERPQSAPAAPSAKTRVLLVEDNPLNQRLTAQQIEKLGYTVTVADTAQEAVAVLERDTFDILLVDKRLPDLDGFALVQRLQATPRFQQAPPTVFALSASTSVEDRLEAEKLGFAGYLTKPIDSTALKAALETTPAVGSPSHQTPGGSAESVPAAPKAVPLTTSLASTSLRHIDLDELKRVMDGEHHETFVAQAISLFLETSPNLLGSLQRALERGDRKTVSRLAHSLKANSQLLGALQLHDISLKLEAEAETADLDVLQATAEALLSEYRMVSNELERLEQSLETGTENP
ncbi:MAG: ATP-binding protein [Opitutales bacterium]